MKKKEVTLDKYINEYKVECELQDKSRNTIESYIRDIMHFYKFFEGAYGEEFSGKMLTMDYKEFKRYLQSKTYKKSKNDSTKYNFSAETINRMLVSIKKFADFLNVKGYTQDNIELQQLKIASKNKDVEVLEKNELNKFKRAIYNGVIPRDICIFETLRNTGVRVSELVNIKLNDIHITERNSKENKSYVIINGKGGKIREIPLNRDVCNAVEKYIKIRPVTSNNYLFQGQRGKLNRAAINNILDKYSALSGIEVYPHMLRHTFATDLIKNDNDIKTVMQLMGHADIKITIDNYMNSSSKDKRRAVESFED